MKTTPNDGGPAFPRGPFYYGPDGRILHIQKDQSEPGMSLRDWFAGMALMGRISGDTNGRMATSVRQSELADDAYGFADAMLKARDNPRLPRDNKPAPDGC